MYKDFSRELQEDSTQDLTQDLDKGLDKIVYQIEESRSGKTFQAYCPELVITGFGDTAEKARFALRSQVVGYLEDCDQAGDLEEVLIEAGFYFEEEGWISNLVKPVSGPNIVIL